MAGSILWRFEGLAPLLAKTHYVVAIDLPGHGLSDPAPPGYIHLLDTVGIVTQLLDDLGWERTAILGHSLGAAIGCLVAGTFPERISQLSLIDALGPYTCPSGQTAAHVRKVIEDYQQLSHKKTPIYQSSAKAVTARLRVTPMRESGAKALVHRGLKKEGEAYRWRTDQRLTVPPMSLLSEEQLESFLKQITAATCLIRPDGGWPFGEALFLSRSACFKHLQVHRMPGTHHVHIDEPEKVAEVFQHFLSDTHV
jgi:pimeloyl-ACP methyl ester carboxylesterase